MFIKGLIGKKLLYVDAGRCPEHIREIDGYVWHERKPDEPVDVMNHCMDAMRYAIHTHVQKNGGSVDYDRLLELQEIT